MGGSYGAALEALACTAVLGLGGFWLTICLASRGRLCHGSVLTANIGGLLPSVTGILTASLGWFSCVESVERSHAWAPTSCIVLALLVAATLIRSLAFAALRALARIVFVCDSGGFKRRAPSWIALVDHPRVGVPAVRVLRLFSRPPPIRFSY
jgi:hypothetical protein